MVEVEESDESEDDEEVSEGDEVEQSDSKEGKAMPKIVKEDLADFKMLGAIV